MKTKIKKIIEKFTATPLVGIDMDDGAVRAVELARNDGMLSLRHWSARESQGENAADLLQKVVLRNGFKGTDVAVGISSPELIVRMVEFPKMPKKELASAIKIEAEQCILNGHVLDEMAVDWHELESGTKERIRGILAVVPKGVIEAQLQTVKAAGLTARIVDVAGLAVWNAYWSLAGYKKEESGATLLIHLGKKTTNLVFAKGADEILLARDLTMGAQDLCESKEDWILEIHDSMVYARSNSGLRGLKQCLVTGQALDQEILESLQSLTGCEVSVWNPAKDIPHGDQKPAHGELAFQLALPIGLALRGGVV